jgi:protein-S-isoprenylcysteine O-methyltransferase Ste14
MFRIMSAGIWLLMPLLAGTVFFACAGRTDLPSAWALLAVLATFGLVLALTSDEQLLRERLRPAARNRDRLTQPLSLVLFVAQWVVAGLDARYGWSPIPAAIEWLGVAGYAAALATIGWAMRTNRFYSSAVRVQSDRGQTAIDSGPYAIVRHPGYAASMTAAVTGGLAFGSWLALLPIALFVVLFVRRTLIEDRLLSAELPGYAQYAARVRYRLIPGML